MVNIPNVLSCLRLPLALLFIIDNTSLRITVLALAMLTDFFDGFLARYTKTTSPLGTILDPLMDKIFAGIAIAILFLDQRLNSAEIVCLLSRDIAVVLYGFFLLIRGQLSQYKVRAIWSGKIATTIQFLVFLGLVCQQPIPYQVYGLLAMLGIFSFCELIAREKTYA